MPSEDQLNLSKARLALAKERLDTAQVILSIGDYKTVANRSYYAVFSAMRAVLALQGFDSKKHTGVIAEFRKQYIKSGIFPIEMSKILDSLFKVRQGSDYDDFYVISKEQVTIQLQNAKRFVEAVEQYLSTQYREAT